MSNRYTQTFTAQAEHIDELGHVNNAVWVDWIQQLATAQPGGVYKHQHGLMLAVHAHIQYLFHFFFAEHVR